MAEPAPSRLRFGPFELDSRAGELWREGRKVHLQEQPCRVLALLLEQRGQVVTRDELRARLWAAETFVDFDHGLNTAIKKLRRALHDSAEGPRYVETVARRGYRFIAPAEEVGAPAGAPGPSRARRPWALAAGLAGLLVVALVAAWAVARTRRRPAAPPPAGEPSLAVLPFANLSGDPQDDYLAEGLTESLITELAKVPRLIVISRAGVLAYKGQGTDPRRVGSELRVGHLLQGSVQRSGSRLRITAQLVDTSTAHHAWAEKYDREAVDLFAVQDEIAARVRGALQPSPVPGISAGMPTPSQEAYDAYLRGRFHLNEARHAAAARVPGESEVAIGYLERAVALDPRFAAAHASLGNAYATRFFLDPQPRWEERADVSIEKALALDPGLAEAYLARALLAWTPANGFPHEQAIEDARHAKALDPSLVEARWMIARVYHHVGLLEEALSEMEAARRIEPYNVHLAYRIGMIYLNQHRYPEALAAFEKVPEVDRDEEIGSVLVLMGRTREALALTEAALRQDPRNDATWAVRAVALTLLGDRPAALRAMGESIRLGQGKGHFHHNEHLIAEACALMGRKEEAVRWLRSAADHGFPCYPFFMADPHLAGLKGDPRFETLMAELRQRWEGYRVLARGPSGSPAAPVTR
jgi:TolB-like protein/DNA-binding winged helix-turn-helix (wHTH) protein/Tfp pilus assembly protein PilF